MVAGQLLRRLRGWPGTAVAAAVIAGLSACGGTSHRPSPPVLQTASAAPVGSSHGPRYRITNTGDIYSTINETDCLTWPSESLRVRGGEDAWEADGYQPQEGEVGVLVGESIHCGSEERILLLEVGRFIVPIAASGAEALGPAARAARPAGPRLERFVITAPERADPWVWETECQQGRQTALTGRSVRLPEMGEVVVVVGAVSYCPGPTLRVVEFEDGAIAAMAGGLEPL